MSNGDSSASDLIAGASAGVVSRSLVAPLDLVKIRLQMVTGRTQWTTVGGLADTAAIVRRTFIQEGLAGFWGGNIAALQLYAAFGAVQFATFGPVKTALQPWSPSPAVNDFIAGATAGAAATTLTFPLDVLRSRGAVLGCFRREHTMRHMLACLVARPRQTVGDMYRGLTPALISVTPYMGATFAIFEGLRVSFPTEHHATIAWYGAVSGVVGKLLVYPLDVCKRRLQMQGVTSVSIQVYGGTVDCLRSMLLREGAPSLFRGLAPSLVKAGVGAASTFASFHSVRGGSREGGAPPR